MLVDKTEFEAWMERIMGELYRISRKLDKAENRQKHLNYLNGERLYDNQEVCQLLRISKRTLQRYRNNGALKFHSIYHKTYYKESDVLEFISQNMEEVLQGGTKVLRRERNQASVTEGQAVGNLSDARRNG